MSTNINKLNLNSNLSGGFEQGCAWINGQYTPIEEAAIPITDVGFTKSDCTYDVVATWNGRFFRLEDHLDRFEKNWNQLNFHPPITRDRMKEILFECVRLSGLRDTYVEMIVTRGIPLNGERDPRKFSNRFYAFAIPYIWIVKPEDQIRGVHLAISKNSLRIDPRSVDPRVKNFHWGDMTKALFEAYQNGAETVVLPNSDGHITEGPGFNIFAIKKNTLWTPENGVLEGVTRKTVLEFAKKDKMQIEVTSFKQEVLQKAEEIFITSTAGGIMPVSTLDGAPVGKGVPGPIFRSFHQRYWNAHSDDAYTETVSY